MRIRLPLALPLGAAIVLVAAGPAFAAGVSYSWTAGGGGNQEWSTAANWGGAAIGTDDLLAFSAGTHAHNNLGVDFSVRGMTLSSPGFLVDGDSILLGAEGVSATADATVNMDIDTAVDQSWSAASGTTLTFPGWVTAASGTITMGGAGTIEISGRLDGSNGAASVVKTGTGTLILSGQGGGIGANGLQVDDGTTLVSGMLASTDFWVNGGTLAGGNLSDPLLGVVRALTLDTGTIAPGETPGEVSTIHTWEPFTANAGGVLEFDVDGTTSDSLDIYKNAVLNGATLHLNVVTAPPVGTILTLVSSQTGAVTGELTSRTGTTLTNGEFTDSGHRWLIGIGQGSASVEYLGAVPTPPADPALADTGVASGWLFPVGGGLLALGVVAFILRRGFTHRANR